MSIAHGLGAAADAFVTVSLAGSLFFNISPDASREQVLLYLLVTMIPLAVLAPLIGPAVDRFRHTQRYVAAGFYFFRALCCLALVSTLLELAFYPIALALLVASKASGIVKQTLVQSLVDDPDALVAANARLARFASITAALAAVGAVLLLRATGPEWTLRVAALLYASAGVVALMIHLLHHVRAEVDELQFTESLTPSIVVSSIGMMAIRAAVGFFIFTIAFSLRRDSEPAYIYGLAAASYAGGAFIGHSAATLLRGRLREEQMIAAAIAAPAVFTAVGILGVSIPLLLLIAGLVGLSTTLGRNAFDALVQRVAPETMLGRTGALYETEFQLAWVFGGIIATPISLPIEVSMTVLTLDVRAQPAAVPPCQPDRPDPRARADRSVVGRAATARHGAARLGGRIAAAGDHRRVVRSRPGDRCGARCADRRPRCARRPPVAGGRSQRGCQRRRCGACHRDRGARRHSVCAPVTDAPSPFTVRVTTKTLVSSRSR